MPNTQSQEKIDLLRLLGAEVRPVPAVPVTDPTHYTFQARDAAAAIPNAVWTNQFDNVDNRLAHFETTGPEIWAQTNGKVDAFTCATGTAGTLAGTAQYLKQVRGCAHDDEIACGEIYSSCILEIFKRLVATSIFVDCAP